MVTEVVHDRGPLQQSLGYVVEYTRLNFQRYWFPTTPPSVVRHVTLKLRAVRA